MATRPRSRILIPLAIPPILIGYGIHTGLTHLETRYPPLDPNLSSSIDLRTPRNPSTQHCPHIDIFAARIPLHTLQSRLPPNTISKTPKKDLTTTWAQTFLTTRLFRAEATAIGLFTGAGFNPGDLGTTPEAFARDAESGNPRVLAHGALVVQRPPAEIHPDDGLLLRWEVPDAPRSFFEKIARWGYPWRLMSGGRHELSVSEPFEHDGDGDEGGVGKGPFVEVRFASAHDYEVVSAEGDMQKTIPQWAGRLHRGYARLLLDGAVRELVG